MSVSLPSKETIVVDVPEVRKFSSEFVYNYHVPDELLSADATNIPRSILSKPSEFFDSDYIDFVKTRIPRFVRFDFGPVFMQNPTLELTDEERRDLTANRRVATGDLLRRYYDKIVGEQEFSSDAFKVVNFTDQSIDTKLYDFVSGSLEVALDEAGIEISSKNKKPADYQKELRARQQKDLDTFSSLTSRIKQFARITPSDIGYDFVVRSLKQPTQQGLAFFKENNDGEKLRGRDITFEGLKNVTLKSQINAKVFDTIVRSAFYNPTHTISGEMTKLASVSGPQQKNARAHSHQVSQTDYMTVVDPIDVCASPTITVVEAKKRIVGYVIDKWELLPTGDLEPLEPILLENQYVSTAVDYKVKYGATYAYQIRSVAEYTMPAITQDDNQLVVIKLLISSKPTKKMFVQCTENVPPPYPTDVDFVWNYETNRLTVTWTFPPNPQRDVKKFQIFRRSSIREPFQLLRMYDFDDTLRGDPPILSDRETVPDDFVETMTNPRLTYLDEDFKKDSKFIYAIASIDAHGFTSGYSVQMEVSFDRFANRLVKRIISISGSPKPYPNMNLARDTFVDSMYHENGSRMKVYFTPEYLALYDNSGRMIPILSTNQKGAEYRIQIINIDNQKQQSIDIGVDDRRRFGKTKDEKFKRQGLKSVDPNRFQP